MARISELGQSANHGKFTRTSWGDGNHMHSNETEQGNGKGGRLAVARRVQKCHGKISKRVVAAELPEEVIEMILARMPFPWLLKVRCLSKSWRDKLPLPLLSVRTLSPSLPFQQEVAAVSPRWPSFCPIYVGKDGILGFDKGSNRWRTLLTFSYIPTAEWASFNLKIYPLADSNWFPRWFKRSSVTFTTSMGPLFCIISDRRRHRRENGYDIYITNVFSKSFRDLSHGLSYPLTPGIPFYVSISMPIYVRILPLDADGYRVLLMFESSLDYARDYTVDTIMLYDSKLKTWTAHKSNFTSCRELFSQSNAYIDEKLFCILGNPYKPPLELWMYDIVKNTWTAIETAIFWDLLAGIRHGAVLRCGDKVMLTIWTTTDFEVEDVEGAYYSREVYATQGSLMIYKINPDSLSVEHIHTSPSTFTKGLSRVRDRDRVHFASDVDSIYLCTSCRLETVSGLTFQTPPSAVVRFNVRTYECSQIRQDSRRCRDLDTMLWGDLPFEPGLNPSLEV